MSILARMRNGRGVRRGLTAASALFCLRAIVPLGYMPASLADGGPFVLCPGTSMATLAMLESHHAAHHAGDAGHAGHAGHAGGLHSGTPYGDETPIDTGAVADADASTGHDAHWEHCPLGIGAGDAAFASSPDLQFIDASPIEDRANAISAPALEPIGAFWARAPPP